jgi:hypothetical protein
MSLDIVNTEDELFIENLPNILKKVKDAEQKKINDFGPSIEERKEVYNIIFKYVKDNKRKLYGGYALNKMLINKNKDYALYTEQDTPDIDFYSPEPINDLIKLCNILYEKGYETVEGREAQHKETYSIFVNYQLYCDITYMPNNIYNKIRFLNIDGFTVVHPWFMMIDYFRMFTDPLVSFWRLEKHFIRYLKLQKTYPLPLIHEPVKIVKYDNLNIVKSMNLLYNFLINKDTILFTGFYVYNYYLYISKYNKVDSKYNYINIPYLEVYSTEYINDGKELLEEIKNNFPKEISSKLSHKEYYPFTQFYSNNVVIYYNDGKDEIPILYVYSVHNKCIPIKKVKSINFSNLSDIKEEEEKINLACFDFNILHTLIILVKVRVDDDNNWNDILYKLLNGYVTFRNYYFKINNITLYDDSIFEGLVIDCIGKTIDPEIERKMMIKERKKQGKPLVFRYEPGQNKEIKESTYIFQNSSGNEIKNDNKLKLM